MVMKGRNELRLNQATLKEVIQYWFDHKLLNRNESTPRVDSISFSRGEDHMVVVKLVEPDSLPSD